MSENFLPDGLRRPHGDHGGDDGDSSTHPARDPQHPLRACELAGVDAAAQQARQRDAHPDGERRNDHRRVVVGLRELGTGDVDPLPQEHVDLGIAACPVQIRRIPPSKHLGQKSQSSSSVATALPMTYDEPDPEKKSWFSSAFGERAERIAGLTFVTLDGNMAS